MAWWNIPDIDSATNVNNETFVEVDIADEKEDPYFEFLYDRYDWSQFNPEVYGYNIIRLGGNQTNRRRRSIISGKYFTVVDNFHYRLLTANGQCCYPLPQYSRSKLHEGERVLRRIYAYRCSLGARGERTTEYVHGLVGAYDGRDIVDHIIGRTLDNRSCMLRATNRAVNMHNSLRERPVNPMLRPGVRWRNRSKTRVGGVVVLGGKYISSDETWSFEEQHLAQKWYLDTLAQYYGQDVWLRTCVDSLVFPPLKQQLSSGEEDIPF